MAMTKGKKKKKKEKRKTGFGEAAGTLGPDLPVSLLGMHSAAAATGNLSGGS